MNFYPAGTDDFIKVRDIVRSTIQEVYPKYYPTDVVTFFLEHHADEKIKKDISLRCVYLLEIDGKVVGTGTIRENDIGRVFVLPDYQGKGYGSGLMKYLEKVVALSYPTAVLSSSLPAYSLYIKLGYVPTEYKKLKTNQGQVLCYHEMEKVL